MQAIQKMVKARTSLLLEQAFFGTLALYLKLVEDKKTKAMDTDGQRLFFYPDWVLETPFEELKGGIAHEVLHCAYNHHTRRGYREHDLWNDACDYRVNLDLIKAGFKLPPGALIDYSFEGMSAEEIYARLCQKRQCNQGLTSQPKAGVGTGQSPSNSQASQPSQPQGGGSGQGSQPPGKAPALGALESGCNPGTNTTPSCPWGKVLDAAPNTESAKLSEQATEWEQRVRVAVSVATKAAGHVPGELQELIKQTNKPKENWEDKLQRFVDSKILVDYSWKRPNRRYAHSGLILPSTIPDGIMKVGMLIDTSLSIDMKLLERFQGVMQHILDDIVIEIIVVHCDTQVQKVERFYRGDELKIQAKGRGGTNFAPGIEWFEENEPDISALIYLTDLDCSSFGKEPSMPLLWAAYGFETELDRLIKKVPFGEVVKVIS